MTQAYNLSQLANNLDSSGRLDATDGLVNAVPVANGGTGASSAAAARTNLGVADASFSVPSGGIIMWSGAQAAIPSGWFLCDGANGTPDLRNRFVVGAGNNYVVGASAGSANAIVVAHSHSASSSVSDPGHSHTLLRTRMDGNFTMQTPIPSDVIPNPETDQFFTQTYSATTGISVSTSVGETGSSSTNANLPPYYALCFIMKS